MAVSAAILTAAVMWEESLADKQNRLQQVSVTGSGKCSHHLQDFYVCGL